MRNQPAQAQSNPAHRTWRPSPPGFAMEDCTICQGTGWELVPMTGMPQARRCSCGSLSHILKLKEQVRIPQRYEHCSLDNFIPLNLSQTRALGEARRFAERFPRAGRGLFFTGDAGVGKTHLAVGIVRDLVQRFREDILFVDFENMLASLSIPGAGGDGWDGLHRTELLVLDNFGTGTPALEDLQRVQELLHGRMRRRKPTIFTSERIRSADLFTGDLPRNASLPAIFLKRLHPSLLYDLLSQVKILPMTGQDFRKHRSRGAPLF